MKAVAATESPFNPRLTIVERPRPKPGRGDVIVEVKAASVNPKDFKLNYNLSRLGTLLRGKEPALFGDDMAGTVVEVGPGVTDLQVGDEVYGMDMRLRTASLAEYARIATKRIARKPKNLSFDQAASVPLAALTALQGLRKGHAKAGSKVLIIGASGGVGTFAVQVAKAMGCSVTAVCGQFNVQRVKDLGADRVINRHAEDHHKLGETFDVVFDVTSFDTAAACAKLMGDKGYFISTAGQKDAYLGKIKPNGSRHQLVFVESYTTDLNTLTEWIEAGQLRPVIAATYPMGRAHEAYELSKSGKANGKIVLNWEK